MGFLPSICFSSSFFFILNPFLTSFLPFFHFSCFYFRNHFLIFYEYLFTFLFLVFVQLFTIFFIFLSSHLKFCVQKLETLTTTEEAVLSNRYVNLQTKFFLTSYRPARSNRTLYVLRYEVLVSETVKLSRISAGV
jgi:hypothetical protein